MRHRRWPAALVCGIALATLLALIWTAGFFYWRLEIASGLRKVREASKARPTQLTWTPSLVHAGSRAIPDLLREAREALARRDRDHALVLCWELCETFDETLIGGDPLYPRIRVIHQLADDSSLELLEALIREKETRWEEIRRDCPPPWRWWSGHRRRP